MFQATKKKNEKLINTITITHKMRISIIKNMFMKHNSSNDDRAKLVIDQIIFNLKSHVSTTFNELLVILDKSEFLKR